jgi:hypothetical protein
VSRRGALLAAALAAAAAAGSAGCGGDRREAERLARGYVAALAAAYRQNDPAPVAPLVGARHLGKVSTLIDLKRTARLVLESEAESLEVTAVERPAPDRLVVRTRERWRYQDRPLDPGANPGPRHVVVLALEYAFVREGGAWKLDEAKALSSEVLEPKGGAPAAPAR